MIQIFHMGCFCPLVLCITYLGMQSWMEFRVLMYRLGGNLTSYPYHPKKYESQYFRERCDFIRQIMWIFRVFSFFLFFASLSLSPLLFISPFHFFSVSSISLSVSLFLRLSFLLSCAFLCLSLLLFTCLFISFSVFFYAVPIPSLDHISMLFNMWTVYNTKEGLAIYAKCFSTPSNIFYIVFPYIDWNSLDFYFFYNIFCWIFLSIHYMWCLKLCAYGQ